jgi:23S rRNA (adenine2030-N6)-methyltransferase
MLSYQHVYHAGNHADVLKHLTIYLLFEQLLKKDKPFTVFDTHAGSGIYHYTDERAVKTGEAQSGIVRLLNADTGTEALRAAAPWIELCRTYAAKNMYPGSPELARNMLRPGDELILSERHPLAVEELRTAMRMIPPGRVESGQIEPHIHFADGWQTLMALTPPLIKRGIVLMDPSYEDLSDFTECSRTICTVHRKWPAGIFALWYPLVERRNTETARMKQEILAAVKNSPTHPDVTDIQLQVTRPELLTGLTGLYGSGMLIINPPYGLTPALNSVLPAISFLLAGTNGIATIQSY